MAYAVGHEKKLDSSGGRPKAVLCVHFSTRKREELLGFREKQ